MSRVIVYRDIVRQRYNIHVSPVEGKWLGPYQHDGKHFLELIDAGPGEEKPLFLALGEDVAWAIAQGIIEGEANDRPSRDAVNDARATRDRSLTMVEKMIDYWSRPSD